MKLRVHGDIKDANTGQAIVGAGVKLFLNQELLQQGKSSKNGFYELIVEIDDSRIESGQQLLVAFEIEGYQRQEHHVPAKEEAFNLDVKLEASALPPKKPFNWHPLIIAGGVLLLLLVVGVILFLIIRPKPPKIRSFFADPNFIESGQSAILRWETKNASSVNMLIDQNEFSVDLSGNKEVQPIQTTEYILIAVNDKGETKSSLILEVKNVVLPELAVTHSPSSPNMEEKVIFTAIASDPGCLIKRLEILVNGRKVNECSESPCTYEGGPYPFGDVSYEACAWVNSQNKVVAGPYIFKTEDVRGPETTITITPSNPTIKEKVTFTAIATDPGGINKLEIYVNSNRMKVCTDESNCIYEGGPYPNGEVSYEAHAWDKSNNKTVAGPDSFWVRAVDSSIVNVSHRPIRPNTEEKVTFTAKATGTSIKIYVQGRKMCSDPFSSCTFTGGPYPAGSVSYYAKTTEWRSSAHSGKKSFMVYDIGKPEIVISCNPEKPSKEDKITFLATAKDPGGIDKVRIYVNGKEVEESKGSSCKYIGGPYPPGNVSYFAYAYDMAGNSQSSGPKLLKIIDEIPPKVTVNTNPSTEDMNQK